MLDPLPIGEEEQRFLKCEICGLEFGNQEINEEDEDVGFDYKNINETGMCLDCNENKK
jgi:hypothetical protein